MIEMYQSLEIAASKRGREADVTKYVYMSLCFEIEIEPDFTLLMGTVGRSDCKSLEG